MRKHQWAFLLIVLSSLGKTACADDNLLGRLAALLTQTSRWEMVAVDVASGKEVTVSGTVTHHPLVPGSLMKLFTTGAVLDFAEQHGPPELHTKILRDGINSGSVVNGNLYLVGGGNPFVADDDLRKAVDFLVQKEKKGFLGDIVADDSFFIANGLERTRRGAGQAVAGALGLDLHTVAVIVTPAEPGKAPNVTVEPSNPAVRFAVEARTTASGAGNIKVIRLDDLSYRVTGNLPAGGGPVRERFPLDDPARFAAGALRSALEEAGIKVTGTVRKGVAPAGAVLLAQIDAPEMSNVIREMNVNSLNVVADNLLLALGAEAYGAPGTAEKGLRAVNRFLTKLGLSSGEATIADGSGLHPANRVSARFMARYLAAVAKQRWFGSFRESLPRAGMDGTMKDIGYTNERFRAKTGRLEDAFALAGYGTDRHGRNIAFAYIVNSPGGAAVNLERSGAEVMRYLAEEVLQ